jgi:SAM-dependent methyltransferase
VNEAALTPRVRHQLRVLQDSGFRVAPGAHILDLGCGEGNAVRALRAAGYDACGCDVHLWDTPRSRELVEAGHLKKVPRQPYRLPWEDEEFDVILSDEVLEHVMNYEDFIAEGHRVQKPGGVALHIFPGPWTPLELHLCVPLATVHRSYPWLLLWAFVGIRNEFQKGQGFREVARFNWKYLRERTNYLSTPTVRRLFEGKYSRVEFREDLFLRSTASDRGRLAGRFVALLPFLLPVYRTCWNRVLLAYR